MSPRTGSEFLIETLALHNVRCVFGIPGTQTVPLFEALRRSRIRTVLATTELSAAFMAGGWARVTGEPGVCVTIPGPGFTWSLTGLAEACLDSVPLLAITGAPPDRPADRRFRQQELAQGRVAAPLVKAVFDALEPSDVGRLAQAALELTQAGEPGPVLLQLSSRAMQDEASPSFPERVEPAPAAPSSGLKEVRSRVAAARRPVLFVGQGVVHDAPEFRRLAECLGAPVLTTPSARGVLPEDHPLALGFDPVAGSLNATNDLLASADLILVVGAKLGHNGTAGFGLRLPPDRLIHVDASVAVLGANYPAALMVAAPARALWQVLLQTPPPKSSWSAAEIAEWRARLGGPTPQPLDPRVTGSASRDPAGFFAGLRRALPREAVLVLDSGLHQLMARRHFQVLEPGGLLFPSDFQSMGFGIPTAIGARLGAPDRPVVALVGDGGFTMTGFEILSAVREGLDLIVIVFVDGELGQIRLHQLLDYGVSHAVHVGHPDLAMVAAALGAKHAEAGDDIEAVVRGALVAGGVTVVKVAVGDTIALGRAAAAARLREGVRRAVGPGLLGWIKRTFRRRG